MAVAATRRVAPQINLPEPPPQIPPWIPQLRSRTDPAQTPRVLRRKGGPPPPTAPGYAQMKSAPDIFRKIEDEGLALVKCGGLPKVITAVCRYSMSKRSMWELEYDFIDILKNSLYCGELEGFFIWMQSYFRSCPDFLKPCVFYLPIFPPNYNIRRRRLLRRWIAEGYCMSTISAERNAENSFEKLMSLTMIQEPPQGINLPGSGINFCQINGFFHEYIMSQPKEDNMVFALEGGKQSQQYTGRHLTIRSDWDRSDLFEIIDFSRLRSLTVFGEWRSFFISKKMQMLRVLDLEDTTSDVSDEDVEQIVDAMSRLKFLSLRGCTTVSRLPTSLGNLKQLETLDVKHTSITMLPETITKLQKLQYIRAGSTAPSTESPSIQAGSYRLPKFCRHQFISAHLGVKVPRGVGKLTGLDTLGVVNVAASGGNAFLKDVKNLIQVRKLAVSGINRQNIANLVSAISGHRLLRSLSMRLDKDEKGALCCVNNISEPQKILLMSLKIHGDVDNFPAWMKLFFSLGKLDLEVTILTQEMIDTLAHGYFKCIRLCVKPTEDCEHNFSIGHTKGFIFLRSLEIDCSSMLLLAFGQHGTEKLEVLKVHSSSRPQISGLANLKGLQQVWLIGSCDNALKQDVERQLAQHPYEIKPVLKLEELERFMSVDFPHIVSDGDGDGALPLLLSPARRRRNAGRSSLNELLPRPPRTPRVHPPGQGIPAPDQHRAGDPTPLAELDPPTPDLGMEDPIRAAVPPNPLFLY
ncbi:hypothetical protein QYE76_006895 [Lolium multiflorum]|uniref:Uncharacterized protein n=1 Tax=Lolium multiflorum TaxID=4521 RepID=A0AAD8W272_LOLMU|nr:hypothetical protein QYE76_006895 [Lolium multiflorum]